MVADGVEGTPEPEKGICTKQGPDDPRMVVSNIISLKYIPIVYSYLCELIATDMLYGKCAIMRFWQFFMT